MNRSSCYRKNLASVVFTSPRVFGLRGSNSFAILAVVLSAMACFTLAGCKSANQYIERGNQLYTAGQYADATLNYRNALKKNPNSGEAFYRLGLALLKQNQAGEAYQSFTHAVALSPTNVPAKIQLGALSLAVYSRSPKHPAAFYKQAQSMADELLKPGGDRVQGLLLKAALALIDNQPGNAVETLREAARVAPDNAEVTGGLAQALLRDNHPDEAETTARQVVQRHPDNDQAYQVLYSIYRSQQNWEKAEAVLKQWSANKPKDSNEVLRLAAFYFARKRPDDGEKTLNSMLDHRDRFPQADLLAGDFHALIHNPQKALADYQRGESRDLERHQIYQERIASTLATLGRLDESVKATDAILAKDPKSHFARALKVQVLERQGGAQNLNTAATLVSDLATETPNDGRVQLLAGQVFSIKGNLDEALKHFQRAAQDEPGSTTAQLAMARLELLRKNYNAVLEHANAALAIRPDDRNARMFHVIGLTGTHAYAAAKNEAEQLARETKDAPQVEMQLGIIALGQGHYAEAEDLFRKLYKEGSPDMQPLAALVNTYEAEHMPDRALALMRAETQKSPDSNGREALLVATAEAAGKDNEALSELQKMAAQNPKSADVQIRIGALLRKDGHLPEALQAFERARQLAPDRKGIDALVANLQEISGKKSDAIASYRKALVQSPDDPTILNNLAFLLAETGGDTKEALQMVSTALRKAPEVSQLRDTLAWIDIKRHDTAGALPILHALTDKYPEDNTYRYHYAVALIQSGNRDAAKQQVETALSQKPTTELAGELRTLLTQVK